MRPIRFLMALVMVFTAAVAAMALPNPNAYKPAAGYATVAANGGNPLDITVTATKPGFGVFWVAITSDATLDPASNSLKWPTTPDKDGAVWRTNTGAKGNMLIPAGQGGYAGFPSSGTFTATVQQPKKPKKGSTPAAATNVQYVLHVINLTTGDTFWTTPGGGTTPPPVNIPPTAQDDCTINVTSNTPITIDVLKNDLPAGSTFTITSYTQPSHGAVVLNADNTFTYTPAANYKGPDSFTYTISNGVLCDDTSTGGGSPYSLTSTVLPNGDVKVVLRQSRDVVDNTYGVNSSPGYPRQGEHWFKDLVNSDHARFVLTNGAGQTVMDFYLDYLSASNKFPSGYGTLGVTGGDGSIKIGNAANIVSVTTTMTDNLNQSPAFYGYTVDSPAEPNANWEYVNGYTFVISKNAFGPSGFGGVTSPDVHNSPAKKGGTTTPTQKPCTSTAKVCLNVLPPPPPPSDCDGILLFGVDGYLTTEMANYLVSNGIPQNQVTVYRTGAAYEPNVLQKAINYFKSVHNGQLPCTMMFDPEIYGPGGQWTGLDANDEALLKSLILGGMGFVYAEPADLGSRGAQFPNTPLGQLPGVLPVTPYTDFDQFLVYDIVDPTSPLVNPTLPGLFLNPYGTGFQSFWPQSSGQDQGLALELLNPVTGVQYANVNVVLRSSSSFLGPQYGTGYPTAYTLDYQPAGGATATQPGGRVAIIGTDPFPKGFDPDATVVSPSILALYYNALVYTAG